MKDTAVKAQTKPSAEKITADTGYMLAAMTLLKRFLQCGDCGSFSGVIPLTGCERYNQRVLDT